MSKIHPKNKATTSTVTKIKKDYKTSTKLILDSSSLQFLLSPFKSKRILIKIIWFCFLFVFLFISNYYVYLNVVDYLNYDSFTSIYEINEKESEFPTISICNQNEKLFDLRVINFFFNNEKLKGEWLNHLELYNDLSFGNCYRFNSGKNMLKQTTPIKYSITNGYYYGLTLNFYANTTFDFGSIIIYFHNHTYNPATIGYNKGYLITSGTFNYFIVKRVFDQKLEYPYNNCFKNISLLIDSSLNRTVMDYFTKQNWTYTQKECINMCRTLKFNELNNCSCNLNSIEDDVYKKCYQSISISTEMKTCAKNYLNFLDSKLLFYCNKYCPLECDTYSYDFVLNTQSKTLTGKIIADTSNVGFGFKYPEFNTYDNYSRTFFGISVYYEELKYTLIKQEPKIELFGLISNIGGTLGLFLGFTFITVLEIFEYITEFIFIYFE